MGMMLPTLQQILAGFDNPRWLLTPGEICSGSKVSGALVFAVIIASWWPCPERHSAMVVNVVLRWTPWFGIMAFGPIVHNVDSGVFADLASWLALLDLLLVCSTPMIRTLLSANDVGRWLYGVFILVQFTAFLVISPCPVGEDEMGKCGVSFVELLILSEVWLLRDKGPKHKRSGRLLVVPIPPFPSLPLSRPVPPPFSPPSQGVQIRVEYKVPSSLLRSLAALDGG